MSTDFENKPLAGNDAKLLVVRGYLSEQNIKDIEEYAFYVKEFDRYALLNVPCERMKSFAEMFGYRIVL